MGTAEEIDAFTLARGKLTSGTDNDDYFQLPSEEGLLEVWLLDYSAGTNDYSLTLEDSTSTLDTGVDGLSEHGLFLDYTLPASTTTYVHVKRNSGGGGSYRLMTRLHRPVPTLNAASPTSGAAGTAVALTGTDFGTSTSEVSVRFGGVEATVTAAASTTLDVVVPQNAPDGEVVVCRPGGCSSGVAFTTGTTTLPTGSYSPPAPADWKGAAGGGVYMSRILLSLSPDLGATDADAAMSAAQASVAKLTAYNQVGFSPYGNDHQYSLTWSSTATTVDYTALFAALAADSRVDAVIPSGRVRLLDSLAPSRDVGFNSVDVQERYAAFDIIGAEEAWRFLATSYPLIELQAVTVGVLDTGLRRDATIPLQEGKVQFQSIDSTATGYHTYWEFLSTGKWDTAPAVVDDRTIGESHGTKVASVLGAADDGESPIDDTVANESGCGLLACVDQWGHDDDADGDLDSADGNGDRFPYSLVALNGTQTPAAGTSWDIPQIYLAIQGLGASGGDFDVLNLSFAVEKLPPDLGGALMDPTWAKLLSGVPTGALVVIGSGNVNVGSGPPTLQARNVLALALHDSEIPTIIAASSNPGGLSTGTDDDKRFNTVTGPEVDIAAPGWAWTLENLPTTGAAIWNFNDGASYAAPQVAGAAALVLAIADAPSASGYAMTPADARSLVLDNSVPINLSWGSPMNRLDLFGSVLAAAELAGGVDKDVRVFAIDYDSAEIFSQIVDPQTGVFEGSIADSASLAAASPAPGCSAPTKVEVDPRGDLVYVLCAESPASILAIHPYSLAVLSEVALAGDVSTSTEFAVTPEGYVVVTSMVGSTAVTEAWDPFDGSKVMRQTSVASAVAEVTGVSAHPSEPLVAVSTYDGNSGNASGEQVAILDLDVYDRTDSSDSAVVSLQDFSSETVDQIMDVEWNPTDDTLACVFYAGGAGYDELLKVDSAGAISSATTIVASDQNWTIAANPAETDDLAYIGARDLKQFAVVDTSLTGPHDPAAYWEYGTYDVRLAEFAQNGKFVALGFQNAPSASGFQVWTIPHDANAAGTFEVATEGDTLSAQLTKPRGVAITPVISLLSPRPGKELSGRRRVQVLVRDPAIEKVSYALDGSAITACPDERSLDDGIADACLLDSKAWTDADDHELTVTAHHADGTTFTVTGRY